MRNRINYKFIYAALGVYALAYFLGGELPYTILFITLSIIIYAIGYMLRIKREFVGFVTCEHKKIVTGDKSKVRNVVQNNSGAPISNLTIKSRNAFTGEDEYIENIFIKPRVSKFLESEKEFHYRGVYCFENTEYILKDPFGIFQMAIKEVKAEKVHVYPKLFQLKDEINIRSNYLDSQKVAEKGSEDRSQTQDIRKYAYGDDIKKIHWKASAKTNGLMVKNYEKVVGNEAFLFVNLNERNMDKRLREEALVEFSLSAIFQLITRSIKSKVYMNNIDEKEFRFDCIRDFYGIYEFFKNNKSNGKESFGEFLKNNINKVPKRVWLGIITIDIDRELSNYIINLKERGFSITVFHDESNAERIAIMERFNIKCVKYSEVQKRKIEIDVVE